MAQITKLPSKHEVCQLPRWAIVAFAARCARRVLPLLRRTDHFFADQSLEWTQKAIEKAEVAAASAKPTGSVTGEFTYGFPHTALSDVVRVSIHCTRAARASLETAAVASDAGYTPQRASDPAYSAAYEATIAAAHHPADNGRTLQGISDDFQRLLELCRTEKWNHFTPVAPSVFETLPELATSDPPEANPL